MVLKFSIQTLLEVLLVAAVIYGFTKEDKLIAFEDKLVKSLKNAKRRKK